MSSPRVLIYLLRRDLRLADNPIFHEASKNFQQPQPYTHLLPIYIFAAQQIEVSGFLSSDNERSPFPEARSKVAGYWRCGQKRATFLAESVWDLRKSLQSIGSGLEIRVGMAGEVIQDLLNAFRKESIEVAVCMTDEEGVEEKREQSEVKEAAERAGSEFRLWRDEKYYLDDRDIGFRDRDLPDIFSSFRKDIEKNVGSLREIPHPVLASPSKLLPLPSLIPPQLQPFTVPTTIEDIITKLHKPLDPNLGLSNPPRKNARAKSAHPFYGGETAGKERIRHIVNSGMINTYKDTRNDMIGSDCSTKLSAWLALGCVTARQVHEALLNFENGRTELGKEVPGYGQGENKGTASIRFELLWRDYFRLTTRKFGPRLFNIRGFRNDSNSSWNYPQNDKETQRTLTRFLEGTTGTGLIDGSQRELFLTGYTSNRARQNVASFLAKHLSIDWRIGAEWYECCLIDYDVSSNWGNWQYVAGVGNDPREARIFNPVKQAHDYDPQGEYIKTWLPELGSLNDPQLIFQPWKMDENKKVELRLAGAEWVEQPLKRIEYHVGRNAGRGAGRSGGKGGKAGGSRGGRGGGGYHGKGRGEKSRGQNRKGKSDRANEFVDNE